MAAFDSTRAVQRGPNRPVLEFLFTASDFRFLPLVDFARGDEEQKLGTAPGYVVMYDMEGVEPDWDVGKKSRYHDCPPSHFAPSRFNLAHVMRIVG